MENLFKARINTKFVRFQLKRNIKFMVLASTLMIALYPLLAFTNYVLNDGIHNSNMFLVGRVFLTIILTLSVFIVPFSLFSYLSSKRNLDVYHALPITRKDLYLSTLVSSILIILIPFTLVFGLGAIYNVTVIPNVDSILLLKQYIFSVVLAIASLMPVLFAMMNTGTLIDGLIYSAILHVLPAIGYGAYLLYGEAILLGFRAGSDLLFLLFTSPIFALFDLNFNVDRIYPNVWLVVVYWALLSFVAAWVILQVYKLRKSEKAETPFTNKWFFPIVSTLFMFIFQVFFFASFTSLSGGQLLDFRTLIFPVVFTFVGYMILDVIANRGFRHFFRATINFIIITVITLSVFYGSVATNGLGYVTKTPKLESVERVQFSFSGGNPILQSISSNSYNYLNEYNPSEVSITFEDPQQIAAIIDVHKNILDEYKKIGYEKDLYSYANMDVVLDPFGGDHEYINYGNFKVKYSLSNGSSLSREYTVAPSWLDGLMVFIQTEEIFNYRYPFLNEKTLKENRLEKFIFVDPFFTKQQTLSYLDHVAFASAYKDDYISKSNVDHIETAPIVGFIRLGLCSSTWSCASEAYPIRKDDTKTLSFLEDRKISVAPATSNATEYLIALKRTEEPISFFYSPSINFDFNNSHDKINVAYINYDEMLQLLPYLDYGSLYGEAINVLRVSSTVLENEEFRTPYYYYGIQPDGEQLLADLLQDKILQQNTLNMILYGDVE